MGTCGESNVLKRFSSHVRLQTMTQGNTVLSNFIAKIGNISALFRGISPTIRPVANKSKLFCLDVKANVNGPKILTVNPPCMEN